MSELQQKKVKNFCVGVIVLLLSVESESKGDESESKGKMLFSTGL